MTVKRCMLIALSLLLVLGIVLSGCARAPSGEGRTLVIGAWYNPGPTNVDLGLIARTIEEETGYSTKIVGGLGLASPERFWPLVRGEHDLTFDISGPTLTPVAVERLDPELFKQFKYQAVYPWTWQAIPFIVPKDLPITSVRDAINKKYPLKVGTGRAMAYTTIDMIWESLGVPDGIDVVKEWGGMVENSASPTKLPPMIREGVLNAYYALGSVYDPVWEDVNSVRPLKVLPISEDPADMEKAIATLPEMGLYVMPAGHYTFVTEDVRMTGVVKFMIAGANLTEEEGYRVTKAIFENRDKLADQVQVQQRDAWQDDKIKFAYDKGVTFHPGALRYYREAKIVE